MFASELSQPNDGVLSPFCLSVGDFSRGRGWTLAPVIPSGPTRASMTSGAWVFRLPLVPHWECGCGGRERQWLCKYGVRSPSAICIPGNIPEKPSGSQIWGVMGGRGQQGRLSFLPTTCPHFPPLPTTLKSSYHAPQTS